MNEHWGMCCCYIIHTHTECAISVDCVESIGRFGMITRADVYKAHEEEHLKIVERIKELQYAIAKTQTIVGEMVESAEANQTVIRSKTLLPTKDFREWAKRIKEVNPNAVVIPCDAEVESAEAAHGWIPCSKRLPENTDEWKAYITCNEAGTISTTYWEDGWNCSRNPNGEINREYEFKDIVAWMPLPDTYKEE